MVLLVSLTSGFLVLQCCGSGAFLTPGSGDPGWIKNQYPDPDAVPDPGSGNLFDPGSGIRKGTNSDPGSRIRDKHPGSATLLLRFLKHWSFCIGLQCQLKQFQDLLRIAYHKCLHAPAIVSHGKVGTTISCIVCTLRVTNDIIFKGA
jgi:hypothetical protein